MTAMCFGLFKAVMGMNFWNTARRLAAVVKVLSCLVMTGSIQLDGFRQYVLGIMYPLVAGTYNLRS